MFVHTDTDIFAKAFVKKLEEAYQNWKMEPAPIVFKK
jgi:hypothetical protein